MSTPSSKTSTGVTTTPPPSPVSAPRHPATPDATVTMAVNSAVFMRSFQYETHPSGCGTQTSRLLPLSAKYTQGKGLESWQSETTLKLKGLSLASGTTTPQRP